MSQEPATVAEQSTSQKIAGAPIGGQCGEAVPGLRERVCGLEHYLQRSVEQGLISPQVAQMAWDAWDQLSAATQSALPVPDTCPGPDGQLMYSWERGDDYLELEIFPDRSAEFFYENEASGGTWEALYTIGEPVSEETLTKLRR